MYFRPTNTVFVGLKCNRLSEHEQVHGSSIRDRRRHDQEEKRKRSHGRSVLGDAT